MESKHLKSIEDVNFFLIHEMIEQKKDTAEFYVANKFVSEKLKSNKGLIDVIANFWGNKEEPLKNQSSDCKEIVVASISLLYANNIKK